METKIYTIDSSVTAVVLTGGLGTRLRSVVADRPKTMALVAGKPFLSYILDQLIEANVSTCKLCTGYMAEHVQEHFKDSYKELKISYSIEQALLGTGGAVRFALKSISSEFVLVMNGDSYCECNLAEFWKEHIKSGSLASMVVTEVPDTRRYGRVNIDSVGSITSFEEKGAASGSGFINAGIYLLHRSLIEEFPAGRQLSLERDLFPKLTDGRLHAFNKTSKFFIDIGTPESFQIANKLFSERRDFTMEG